MVRGVTAVLLALSAMPLASSITLGSQKLNLAADADAPKDVSSYTFEDFAKQFKKKYTPGSPEWFMRQAIFENSKKSIHEHHQKPGKKWQKGINKFADWTNEEYKKLMGYKPSKGKKAQQGKLQLLGLKESAPEHTTDGSHPVEHTLDLNVVLPTDHDNRDKLNLANTYVRDQGACGSCWAVSTTSVLEAHLEMNKEVLAQLPKHEKFEDIALSSQALTSCVQNLNKCGGSGGCEGATSELALQLVQDKGIPMGMDYMYTSGNGNSGTCNAGKLAESKITIGGFVKLPENSYKHLLHALYQVGPAVVSVAANDWSQYASGIFESDDKTINHAVACMGFGEDAGTKYWLIKNSWGPDWGEEGHIRLLRSNDDDENCAWDTHPEEGTGCEGGPEKVWVCGNSGVLYDSTYPVDVKLK